MPNPITKLQETSNRHYLFTHTHTLSLPPSLPAPIILHSHHSPRRCHAPRIHNITDPTPLLVVPRALQPAHLPPRQKLPDPVRRPQLVRLRRLEAQVRPRQLLAQQPARARPFGVVEHAPQAEEDEVEALDLLDAHPRDEDQVGVVELRVHGAVREEAEAARAAHEVGQQRVNVERHVGGRAGGRGERQPVDDGEDEVQQDALEGAERPGGGERGAGRGREVPFVLWERRLVGRERWCGRGVALVVGRA